ncbi:MAG TPA: 4Fe-4S dicluster domain-containing protein, partial [Geopsychrobacteraceae bacterium]|nr:4Fe-4S dicluster domain-containing protein [Geopsychrobacteraceae bacterium]
NPERFAVLTTDNDCGIVGAALRFNVSNQHVTSALVGFSCREEVDQAVSAMADFSPDNPEVQAQIKEWTEHSLDGLCTGCGYCLPCPVDIPIPKYLDAYNQVLLNRGDQTAVHNRLKWHWNLTGRKSRDCTQCGLCEQRCTQHLPIRKRLSELPVRED